MTKPIISAIAAMNNKRVIGIDNNIPWHSAEDFKHFREKTEGTTVIMGRKTWDSLPKKPLPGRINMVVTRDPDKFIADNHEAFLAAEGKIIVKSDLTEAIDYAQLLAHSPDIWIIGGEQIYDQAIAKGLVDVIELTVVDNDALGSAGSNAFMPEFEDDYDVVSENQILDTDPKLTFYKYQRKP